MVRACGTGGITFNVGSMKQRDPIHLGSGEPMLLLHPFILSQNVWKRVAPLIADTGRYEVFAPTMAGHNGGARGQFFLDTATLADDIERRMDALGWGTAHIVGNSLGGWVSFELERRGRARTLTGIAPAGGWNHFTPAKFEIVAKFLAAAPVFAVCRLLGKRAAKFPFARQLAYPAVSASPDSLTDEDVLELIDDAAHCSAYYQMLVKSLHAARPARVGADPHADPSGDLREGPGAADAAIHPPVHRTASVEHKGDDPRRRRPRADVRSAATDRRRDHRIRRPVRPPQSSASSWRPRASR